MNWSSHQDSNILRRRENAQLGGSEVKKINEEELETRVGDKVTESETDVTKSVQYAGDS